MINSRDKRKVGELYPKDIATCVPGYHSKRNMLNNQTGSLVGSSPSQCNPMAKSARSGNVTVVLKKKKDNFKILQDLESSKAVWYSLFYISFHYIFLRIGGAGSTSEEKEHSLNLLIDDIVTVEQCN